MGNRVLDALVQGANAVNQASSNTTNTLGIMERNTEAQSKARQAYTAQVLGALSEYRQAVQKETEFVIQKTFDIQNQYLNTLLSTQNNMMNYQMKVKDLDLRIQQMIENRRYQQEMKKIELFKAKATYDLNKARLLFDMQKENNMTNINALKAKYAIEKDKITAYMNGFDIKETPEGVKFVPGEFADELRNANLEKIKAQTEALRVKAQNSNNSSTEKEPKTILGTIQNYFQSYQNPKEALNKSLLYLVSFNDELFKKNEGQKVIGYLSEKTGLKPNEITNLVNEAKKKIYSNPSNIILQASNTTNLTPEKVDELFNKFILNNKYLKSDGKKINEIINVGLNSSNPYLKQKSFEYIYDFATTKPGLFTNNKEMLSKFTNYLSTFDRDFLLKNKDKVLNVVKSFGLEPTKEILEEKIPKSSIGIFFDNIGIAIGNTMANIFGGEKSRKIADRDTILKRMEENKDAITIDMIKLSSDVGSKLNVEPGILYQKTLHSENEFDYNTLFSDINIESKYFKNIKPKVNFKNTIQASLYYGGMKNSNYKEIEPKKLIASQVSHLVNKFGIKPIVENYETIQNCIANNKCNQETLQVKQMLQNILASQLQGKEYSYLTKDDYNNMMLGALDFIKKLNKNEKLKYKLGSFIILGKIFQQDVNIFK